ncbi:MAG: NAD+ kinase [Leptospiraceae bacterium]|nr:NAD+ kinase [Leptospiraceae bacterium]
MNQALIVMKKTKYELDMNTYKDLDFYKKICLIQNNSFDKIYNSHLRQLKSREILKQEVFENGKFIFRDELENLDLSKFGIIVALGGDNHFTYVAHHCEKNRILGCNSDSETSFGALLAFTPQTLKETVLKEWNDTQEENWSIISVEIEYPDGKKINTVNAVSEISIRNANPDLTSRYVISHEDKKEEQKSSGLLLYTGAGSTGWYASCKGEDNEQVSFSKSANFFRVYARELSRKARQTFKLTDFTVTKSCQIISEMNGGISIDALPERVYSFPAGSTAKLYLSNEKLKVITKKETNK